MPTIRFFARSVAACRPSKILFCALLAMAIGICGSVTAEAQSGRHVPKPKNPPPTQPTESTPTPEPAARSSEPPAEKPQLMVVLVRNLPHVNSSFTYTDQVIAGCTERLMETRKVDVTFEHSQMNRKEAGDRARTETEAYVVMIELELDVTDTEDVHVTVAPVNPAVWYVNYMIFEPRTGKMKSFGKVYQRPVHTSPLPTPRGSGDPTQYQFHQAGRETADRLLGVFNLTPSVRLPK